MGSQIIRQPNGRLAIYSSVTDTITMWDATPDEVLEWYAEKAAESARRQVREILRHVTGGQPGRSYHQFALSWERALERDRKHGGEAWRQFGGEEASADG